MLSALCTVVLHDIMLCKHSESLQILDENFKHRAGPQNYFARPPFGQHNLLSKFSSVEILLDSLHKKEAYVWSK